jgi:hypothetical protein
MLNPTKRPLATGLIVLGVILRLIPHPANFTPVGGLTLFAGARLRRWQAYLVPLMIMIATDSISGAVGGFGTFTVVTPFVYGSLLISVWIGSYLRLTEKPWLIGSAIIVASVQFFIISNFGMWLSGISFYPLTLDGLAACYLGGLPYLGRTLVSDLLYCGLLFGLHSWLTRLVYPPERVAA